MLWTCRDHEEIAILLKVSDSAPPFIGYLF